MNDLMKGVVFVGIFLVPFLPIYVENEFFFPFITGKNFAFRIIVELIFAAWIVLLLTEEKYRPRFSWMTASFAMLLFVMFFANILGEYPLKSFWSNFERMDGYVTLVHLFALILVLGNVLTTEKLWRNFFIVSSAVALFVALYGLAQFSQIIEGGRGRIDSRLGNAAYMAVYMLFHIFIVAWLAVRSRNWTAWLVCGFVGLILIYTLLFTGTRGTFLGFAAGSFVAVSYVALFAKQYPKLKKFALWGVLAIVALAIGFVAIKDSELIQGQPGPLKRIANIDIVEDLKIRSVIWSMALDGVKERPLLGWGQGNFNYVFNKEFVPEIWNREAWFDRVHDIVLDWLIAGGILGFLAYLSIFISLGYYLFWLPLVKNDQRLDVLERAVIIGLLVGYVMHNLVVFDNIISYIFFGSIVAFVHFRVSEKIDFFESLSVDKKIVNQVIAPVVILSAFAIIYFANVPGIKASVDIIDAMQASDIGTRLAEFHSALERGSFADQEIVEQLAQQAMSIARNPNIPVEQKNGFVQRAELELLRLIEKKPGDARLHNFLSTFYRNIGAIDQAREQAAIARSLSPRKPAIVMEQGVIEIQAGNIEAARNFFQEAFDLAPDNTQARVFLASLEIQLGNLDKAKELLGEEYLDEFAANDYALESAYRNGDTELMVELYKKRIEKAPDTAQNWASLAFIYYEDGQIDKTLETLREAVEKVPSFKTNGECFIANIEAGNEPAVGCVPE